jgi:D-amino-acid oxidase
MTDITVIGSGVSGLSSAIQLQKAGFDVTIITRDHPQQTTSVAAGAVWYGGSTAGRDREWAEVTLAYFMALSQQEQAGVAVTRLREVFPHEEPDPWYKDIIPYFERVPIDELPSGRQDGFDMDVPIVESPRYLQYLYDTFIRQGGVVDVQEIRMLDELKYEHPLIVNCTGVWAKQVADDPSVYPIRGQTIVVDAPYIKQGYMDDHNFTYLFPREDGVLIGGIAEPHTWNLEIDAGLTADIVARCSQVNAVVGDAPIVKQFVGLRPGRDTVRLEVEELSEQCTVIHNYGHAGLGYTLSWGCADDVVALAQNISAS